MYIDGGLPSGNTVAGCTIASNQGGVNISGSGTSHNVVEGDYIGTDAAGDAGLGNTLVGVTIYSGATDNTIGGTTADAADVIAGNLGGVGIENLDTTGNVVEGNFIGTDVAGDTDLGNFVGIQILGGATDNTIGGTASGAGNTIADNGFDGVTLTGPETTGNLVAGNTISWNGNDGVAVSDSSSGGPTGNAIGGSSSAYGNDISFNGNAGIYIQGSAISGNLIAANTISDNFGDGVDILGSSSGGPTGNAIGGSSSAYGNDISGNGGAGIYVYGSGVSLNLIAANTISDNTGDGIDISASSSGGPTGNVIGGSSSAYGNDISGNGGSGIFVFGSGVSLNLIAANTISNNADDGVDIFASSAGGPTGNIIGGTSAGYANTITSNGDNGIYVAGSATTGNLVTGNFIGTDSSDDLGLGNSLSGVRIEFGASGNTISENVIASNAFDGVTLDGDGTSDNLVEDNFLGTDSAGDTGLGNGDSGVAIFGGASSNTISGNTISASSA